ncbi:uncharacterized protein LOC113514812 [Galleria mellonella]|uniref:Uncharacterized protein LOC113514812 n=1 Tax=Galleria mellonella TaxID=7137 RepID=A0ABM3N381_GALME|nr:uncharacterized protein LOC113514812 [Galleria mellonella]
MAARVSEQLLCITLMFILIVHIETLSGKEFYCRDPDTGKLHDVNTTWPSETFCGNYTCKLRKINLTETQYAPIRQINVNDVPIYKMTDIKMNNNDIVPNDESQVVKQTTETDTKVVLNKKDKPQIVKNNILEKTGDGTDRLLNKKEIKTISELLHDVKRSDLEAILDIYNLAQDLYKEMDRTTNANIIEETAEAIKQQKGKEIGKNANVSVIKNQYVDNSLKVNSEPKEVLDMDFQTSNIVQTTVPPRKGNAHYDFGGNLGTKDFGRLPYYYPLSSFQRQYSYYNPSYTFSQYMHNLKPCTHQAASTTKSTPVGLPSYGNVIKKPFAIDSRKSMQPLLLSYPYSYIQHYNTSGYANNVYYKNPWNHFDVYKQSMNYQPYYVAKLSNPQFIKAEPNNVKVTNEKSNSGDLLDTLLLKTKVESNSSPGWQTKPLSRNILDEVKANFEQKSMFIKPISLRKKINLERVGKVIKLDDLNRNRRSIEEEKTDADDYEAYLEKTTCKSDEDPGYFRVGNLTEPYPACCPQRINS